MKKGVRDFLSKYGEHIKAVCGKYKIKKLWMFGSAVDDIETARDYDFAVSGYPTGKFFSFYSDLDWELDKGDSDLIDYDLHKEKNHFLIRAIDTEGVVIYEG